MDIKNFLIAVDLDDTIVYEFNKKDEKSFEKLKELAKDNIVVIATGRPNRSSIDYYNALELNTPLLNYNGALVHNPKDNSFPVSKFHMKKEYLKSFIEDNDDLLVNIFCEIEDDIYLHRWQEEIKPFLHLDGGKLHVGPLQDILQNDPNGAIIFSIEGSKERLENYVKEKYKGEVLIRFWNETGVIVSEFYSPFMSKGVALEKVREYYNIDKDKTITFGDGHNDIDMIKFAKYGVAMGGSNKELEAIAKYHTDSIREHGVYNFLTRLEKGEIE